MNQKSSSEKEINLSSISDPIHTEPEFDLQYIQPLISETLMHSDDGELFIEHSVSENFVFDDGRLKSASYDSGHGFGLRFVSGETIGYAHASELTLNALKRACQTVQTAKNTSKSFKATPPQRTNRKLYPDINPVTSPDFKTKIQLLHDIDQYIRSKYQHIAQVSVSLSGMFNEIEILRADGHYIKDIRPLVRLNIQASIEKNGQRETGFSGAGGRNQYHQWIQTENWQKMADEAIKLAEINLEATHAPAGEMDVVLGSGWPGILLHEAIGHGLEGDFNRKGSSAFSNRMGEQIASKGVTIIDDGTIEKKRGSLTIDDEGEPSQKTVLVEDGILKSYMQDRMNARLMGVKSTGNGRRESFAHIPIPRMTNTFMLGGQIDPGEILESLKDGIYAVNFGGGQVDITSGKFVFQCTEAYRVRNGKICEPVKGASLIGDGPSVLHKISMVGNDFNLDPGVGTCGKAGQGVPVGVGQPSLKISGLTIGGQNI